MTTHIDVYYDFRSPYAYFTAYRLRNGLFQLPVSLTWRWRPVSIDVLLNLQSGREPWAPYADPLSSAKRRHLIADVQRYAAFYGALLRPPQPPRPNSVTALCIAHMLDKAETRHDEFRSAIFDALWRDQRDIGDAGVLAGCLSSAGFDPGMVDHASTPQARELLTTATQDAYNFGIFGVPSFVSGSDVYFGNDRLDLLGWRLQNRQ
jgi:2-hydroxychromene-2-carboxylate isomerase